MSLDQVLRTQAKEVNTQAPIYAAKVTRIVSPTEIYVVAPTYSDFEYGPVKLAGLAETIVVNDECLLQFDSDNEPWIHKRQAQAVDLATQAELDTHASDTTAVHGIADTSALVIDGDTAGGDLSGTYPNPRRKATGAFRAKRGSNFGPSAAGSIAIPCDSELNDVSSWYDPTTGKFTPQLAGYYHITGHVHVATFINTGRFLAALIFNSTFYFGSSVLPVTNSDDYRCDVARTILFNGTTDNVGLGYNHNNASSLSVGPECELMGFFVGTA